MSHPSDPSNQPTDPQAGYVLPGWTILPCEVPLPSFPERRYFLTDRVPTDCSEFEMTMREDYVDAFCADHAFALAEYLFGREWGTVSRIEWLDEAGKARITDFKGASFHFLPDGTKVRTVEPQIKAKAEWVAAVENRDEAAILRLMQREIDGIPEWLSPMETLRDEVGGMGGAA